MIEQNVQVIRCEGEKIWLRLGSQSGCSVCDKGNGCGAGVFAKLLQRKPVVLELPGRNIDAKPGQMVTLAFPEQVYLKMVFAYYGYPLIAALVGALIGYSIGSELGLSAVMIDAATLASGVLAAFLMMRGLKKQKATEVLLNAMKMAVYRPSSTQVMCGQAAKDVAQN
jgi:sigma-E factor negative regulatory protein RseC